MVDVTFVLGMAAGFVGIYELICIEELQKRKDELEQDILPEDGPRGQYTFAGLEAKDAT